MLLLLLTIIGLAAAGARAACDTPTGYSYLMAGNLSAAKAEFACTIHASPSDCFAYAGLSEAYLMEDNYIQAQETLIAYQGVALYAVPACYNMTVDFYDERLALTPTDKTTLRGFAFFSWVFFDYLSTISATNLLLIMDKFDNFANAFGASARSLFGVDTGKANGMMGFAEGHMMFNPSIHWVEADRNAYGLGKFVIAYMESATAIQLGAETFRIRAIMALSYAMQGNKMALAAAQAAAAFNIKVATLARASAKLVPSGTVTCSLVYQGGCVANMTLAAGQTADVSTSSADFYDTIMYVRGPAGDLITYNDDQVYGVDFFARVSFTAPVAGIYWFNVTSFDALATGLLTIQSN